MVHIFGRYLFPHVIKGDYETPDLHLDLIQFLSSPDTGAAIVPRGHAKSTWEKIDSLHDIVYKLEPVIVYYGDALESAQFHFDAIRAELESNDLLRAIYGNLVPSTKGRKSIKWNSKHFETTNGVNMVARGAGKGRGVNIKNRRPTKIVVDDGETDEQTHSKMRREKYHRWVTEVLIPSLDPEVGKLKMIGTVIHPHCEVLRFYKEWGGIFRAAIENGKSVWPQMWPLWKLERLRDGWTDENGKVRTGIGLRAFMQEFMNNPINDDTTVFKQEHLDEYTYEVAPTKDELKQHFKVVMAVDPNAGLSQMADFMGVVVMGLDRRNNKRWVLYAQKFKLPIKLKDESQPSQFNVVDEVYDRFNPNKLGVEKVMNQTALYQILEGEGKYRLQILEPRGKDKVARAEMQEPHVAQGHVLFHPSHVDLYNELVEFPNGNHDDLADAFVYANEMLDENSQRLTTERHDTVTGGLINETF